MLLLNCVLILSTDGDIDFILAPAVGSLTTASTGTSQGPSTSTIPGAYQVHYEGKRRSPKLSGAKH